MSDLSDAQLLRQYAELGSEAAFRELAARHTDLVYSAALRQVNSPDLARDITQSVFTDLARKAQPLARKFPVESSLAGWLHRGTRFAALNLLRDTRRRIAYEKQAMEQLLANADPPPDWDRLRPVLDEALDSLGDEDQQALLLRFFKNQDFRAVGRALGVSDDTAQKRVTRALERLRQFLAKRGVALGASGLAALLSAQAIQAAPAGLAATVAATAALAGAQTLGAALATTSAIATTQTIAMTALQKFALTAALAAAIGAGLYETQLAAELRRQNQTLKRRQAERAQQWEQLRREGESTANRLAAISEATERFNQDQDEQRRLRAQIAQLRRDPPDALGAEAQAWMERVSLLKQRMEQMPGAKIPELRLLTERDWLSVAKDSELRSEKEIRQALSQLRSRATNLVGHQLQAAMNQFTAANDGVFTTDLALLKPYLDSPLETEILARYSVQPSSALKTLALGGDWVILPKQVDGVIDDLMVFGPNGMGGMGGGESTTLARLATAIEAYRIANQGNLWPGDATLLTPYITTPEQQAAYKELLEINHNLGR